jgi:hypothetical protein
MGGQLRLAPQEGAARERIDTQVPPPGEVPGRQRAPHGRVNLHIGAASVVQAKPR